MVDGARMVMMEGKVSVFLMIGVLMFPVRVVQIQERPRCRVALLAPVCSR